MALGTPASISQWAGDSDASGASPWLDLMGATILSGEGTPGLAALSPRVMDPRLAALGGGGFNLSPRVTLSRGLPHPHLT